MAKSSMDILVEKYYNIAKKCFEASGTWREVIRKFPPQTIRLAVRRIVERFIKADEDPDQFDFCDFFTEQLPEFESVDAFIEYLDKKRYIPPDPEEQIREMLNYLEQEANSLGYRLVKEEEWAKITGRWDNLLSEVERLKQEKKMLEEKVRELEKALEEYEKTGKTKITRLTAEPVAPTKKEKPPAKPPPPAPVRPKMIKELMTYDELVRKLKSYLQHEGITTHMIDKLMQDLDSYVKEIYETKDIYEMTAELERIITYISEEYIPARYIKISALDLTNMGVEVREPNPTRVYGMVMKPPISYIYPRFVDWANSLERSGYKVSYEPAPATRGTHFIHEPKIPAGDIVVALDKELNIITLSSAPAISYYFDEAKRVLIWYRYPMCRLLLR